MLIRLPRFIVPLAIAALLPAQQNETKPATKPTTSRPTSKPTANDRQQEVVGVKETAADRVAKLQAELARVDRELTHIQRIQKDGGMVGHVRKLLSLRGGKVRTYVPIRNVRGANTRAFTSDEKKRLPAGTMFTVNGHPVAQAEFDSVYRYLSPQLRDESMARRKTIEVLAMRTAAKHDNPQITQGNYQRLAALEKRMAGGADFEQLCAEISEGPAAKRGGDMGFIRAGGMDPLFMMTALSLEPGNGAIVESSEGMHYIECRGFKNVVNDSDRPERAVHVRQIFLKYSDTAEKARENVRSGLAEMAFSDPLDMQFAPGK